MCGVFDGVACAGSLERLLDAPLVDIVPAGCVVPAWIRHNISSVNERGLVLPLPAGQPDTLPPLPHWLLLAMKSLANCEYGDVLCRCGGAGDEHNIDCSSGLIIGDDVFV